MLKFKLKLGVGNHTEKNLATGENITYTASEGKIIFSANDLAEMFPDKFDRVTIGDPVKEVIEKGAIVPNDTETKEKPQEEAPEPQEKAIKPKPLGVDKTKLFPVAVDQDFKVFYAKGKGYIVAEIDEPTIAFWNSQCIITHQKKFGIGKLAIL